MTRGGIQLVVEDGSWRAHRGLLPQLADAAEMARKAARLPVASAITILLADDTRLKALNREFRKKNKPTNVLSFTSGEIDYCGDIALAYGVTRHEAMAAKKRFAHHAAHLVVHGVLHLAGYDHERTSDAKAMEALETRILAKMGVADPYGPTEESQTATGRRKSSVAKRPRQTPTGRTTPKKGLT